MHFSTDRRSDYLDVCVGFSPSKHVLLIPGMALLSSLGQLQLAEIIPHVPSPLTDRYDPHAHPQKEGERGRLALEHTPWIIIVSRCYRSSWNQSDKRQNSCRNLEWELVGPLYMYSNNYEKINFSYPSIIYFVLYKKLLDLF